LGKHNSLKYCISVKKAVTRGNNKVITRYKEYHKTEKKISILVFHQQTDQEQPSFQMEQSVKGPAHIITVKKSI